jgi:putative cell wall-binding protein
VTTLRGRRWAASLLTVVLASTVVVGAYPAPVQAVSLPEAGNPDGHAFVPAAGRAEDTSSPDIVIGNGTPSGCTSAAVVSAVAQGGVITFDCGPAPITIDMYATARVFNNTGPKIVLDGGGKVTLNGRDTHRILYMNTCDPAQVWTTPHCQNQDHPQLTVQNLTFVNANSKSETTYDGGGAIWVRGGRFKVVNSRFFNNVCADSGPDVGGGAIRVFSQYNTQPVYVVNSTFGGALGLGNVCSNGGALSSIGVSWTVINSVLSHNDTTGWGANPPKPGTPGGGNGGAIALDGNTYTLDVVDSIIEHNHARAGGGGIFYVSNNRTGELYIRNSFIVANPSDDFETPGYPGLFIIAKPGFPVVENSLIAVSADPPVDRLAGGNRYATAAAISSWAYPGGAAVVYVATGSNFPDALGGGSAAAAEGGPLLLVARNFIPAETAAEMSRLSPSRVVVLGGTGAVSSGVASNLGVYGTVERRAGADRYSTAVEVSKGAFSSSSIAYISTGMAFPDAMVAGAAAANAGAPLLLVPTDNVPDAVLDELTRLGVDQVVVVGGPAAVSGAAFAQLQTGGRTVTRLAGSDRFSSAAALSANTFSPGVSIVFVAVGTNYPDALAGAAASAIAAGPVLLVQTSAIPSPTASELSRLGPSQILVLGGSAVVSVVVASQLAAFES